MQNRDTEENILLKYEYVTVSLLFCDSKLNILGFWSKRDTLIDIFQQFLTFYGPSNNE